MKKAFTLIELIITMVILSIVAYVASGLIVKAYIGYNYTNAIHTANLKAESAITSIINRLEYAINGTIVKRKSATDSSLEVIDQAPSDYKVLEWVGYAKDSFEANNIISTTTFKTDDRPGWSGFCNIRSSGSNFIITPGSDLNLTDDTINRLSNQRANLKNSTVAIFFPGNYNYRNIGYNGSAINGVSIISGYNAATNRLNLSSPTRRITEHYKLAWSAYAVLPVNCTADGCDLVLRYNFRPWNGEDYNTERVVRSQKLLATNVTVFKTYATQNRVHIKICVKEKFGINKGSSVCREKVVFKWKILKKLFLC